MIYSSAFLLVENLTPTVIQSPRHHCQRLGTTLGQLLEPLTPNVRYSVNSGMLEMELGVLSIVVSWFGDVTYTNYMYMYM